MHPPLANDEILATLARATGLEVVGGRPREPKLEHDLRLLEGLIPASRLAQLRSRVAPRSQPPS